MKNDVGARFGGFEDSHATAFKIVVVYVVIEKEKITTVTVFRAAKLYVRSTIRADV
jgi:ABC-type iron transport system FetAB permease component